MEDLKKKFPGTVIEVLDRNDPAFQEKLNHALEILETLSNRSIYEILMDKMNTYGTAVSCCRPDGYMIEGDIVRILPYGCEWYDKEWKGATVVVKNHETKEFSNWRPDYVTFV